MATASDGKESNLINELVMSDMTMLPAASRASPPFPPLPKVALVPIPFVEPAKELPASVATYPVGDILRMRAFTESNTYTTLFELTVIPVGLLNAALVPCPSAKLPLL